jgi:hypothetical protein
MCVLPFVDRTHTEGLVNLVRESFSGHLSVKRFVDMELHDIDTRLEKLSGGWDRYTPQQLGQLLQCDALVYGELSNAQRLYLGIYAQLTLEGKIRVVDTRSGQPLVAGAHTTTFHSGGVPFSVLAAVPNAVLNLRSMGDTQMIRAIDDLGRHLAEKVPDLPAPSSTLRIAAESQVVPSPSPAGGVVPSAYTSADLNHYQVQVAAFSSAEEAQQAVQMLRDRGFRPTIVRTKSTDRTWHKVIVGPFPSADEARQASERIQKSLRFTPIVVQAVER